MAENLFLLYKDKRIVFIFYSFYDFLLHDSLALRYDGFDSEWSLNMRLFSEICQALYLKAGYSDEKSLLIKVSANQILNNFYFMTFF